MAQMWVWIFACPWLTRSGIIHLSLSGNWNMLELQGWLGALFNYRNIRGSFWHCESCQEYAARVGSLAALSPLRHPHVRWVQGQIQDRAGAPLPFVNPAFVFCRDAAAQQTTSWKMSGGHHSVRQSLTDSKRPGYCSDPNKWENKSSGMSGSQYFIQRRIEGIRVR